MVGMAIPQMNKHLEDMNRFFNQKTQEFRVKISQHQGRFNSLDQKQFENLLNQIKAYAMDRITAFFNGKLTIKCQIYDSLVTNYTENGNKVERDLARFRQNLEQATIEMKEQQNRKEQLMESLSKKYCQNILLKKCLKILKNYEIQRKMAKIRDHQMDLIYQKNLLKKSFFPWRTLTYKDGYANTVRKETEKDIMSIHTQYQSIIQILKKKIIQTQDIIKIKKAAKGQFAYALSKNLLKTISNLSLEVMSLNQMSLRDGEWNQDSTVKFMGQVDYIIKQKLSKVRQYRRGLVEQNYQGEQGQEQVHIQKKKKHITFI